MGYEFRSGGNTPKYANNGMCTLKLHHGGWFENGVYKKGNVCYLDNIIVDFLSLLDLLKIGRGLGYEVDISQVEQRLEIRCKNPEGGLEFVTSDATVVEMVGHIHPIRLLCYTIVRLKTIRVELPNEDIGAHLTIDNEGVELPNEDIGAHLTIDNEGAELPNENEDTDSEIKDSDYEFSENEAEDRPTVRENIADEETSHDAPGQVSSDGADTSEFDSGSETDSEVKIKTQIVKGETVFQMIYVCLAACKKGFLEGCRHVIGVNGCHLKGPYTGQILTAVGVDGNNGCFPVAYAVVDIESKDSWIWFFNLLIEDLGITNGKAWVVISDKQKGLVSVIERALPTAEHRMCVRHLYSNFRASHIGLALKHML
ncbi:hypothetical protein L3X38_025800 [Prunus dulcis]|uniref:MULE transposase domain-containing protein n=1 Tax=Prunus dulcis TaxID=3755 RepID=A0AAD4W364_PRUDU|nr:hypothetical protein L3X38_025800 [Prunus dulcis]